MLQRKMGFAGQVDVSHHLPFSRAPLIAWGTQSRERASEGRGATQTQSHVQALALNAFLACPSRTAWAFLPPGLLIPDFLGPPGHPRSRRLTQQRSPALPALHVGGEASLTDSFSSLLSMFSIPLRASPASSLLIFSNSQPLWLL